MTVHTKTSAFYINNGPAMTGELSVEQDVRRETTGLSKADDRWEFTDSNGHYHAYSKAGIGDPYPTLDKRSEHVDCDGSCDHGCEGYSITRWFCRICKEEIEPGRIPGPHSFEVPGLKTWTVTVDGHVEEDWEQVSVRIEREDEVLFGVAAWMDTQVSFIGMERTERTTLIGTGPLGKRSPS